MCVYVCMHVYIHTYMYIDMYDTHIHMCVEGEREETQGPIYFKKP